MTTKPYTVENRILEDDRGNHPVLRRYSESLEMEFTDQADYNSISLYMWEQAHVALSLWDSGDSFVVKASGDKVQMEDKRIGESAVDKSNLFICLPSKAGGEWIMESVGEPKKYLCVGKDRKVILTPNIQNALSVRLSINKMS